MSKVGQQVSNSENSLGCPPALMCLEKVVLPSTMEAEAGRAWSTSCSEVVDVPPTLPHLSTPRATQESKRPPDNQGFVPMCGCLIWSFILKQVTTEEEQKSRNRSRQAHNKVVMFACGLVAAIFSVAITPLWWSVGCKRTAGITISMAPVFLLALAHLRHTKSAFGAHIIICYGTSLLGVLAYYSFGGNVDSLGLSCWAFLGPSLVIITDHPVWPGIVVHVLCVLAMVFLTTYEVLVGPMTFREVWSMRVLGSLRGPRCRRRRW